MSSLKKQPVKRLSFLIRFECKHSIIPFAVPLLRLQKILNWLQLYTYDQGITSKVTK